MLRRLDGLLYKDYKDYGEIPRTHFFVAEAYSVKERLVNAVHERAALDPSWKPTSDALKQLKISISIIANNSEAYAKTSPSGIIVLTMGLFSQGVIPSTETSVDPDSLAVILGHEIGHLIANHEREGGNENGGGGKRVDFTYPKEKELEADYIGVILMANACFDPRAAERVWTRLKHLDIGDVAMRRKERVLGREKKEKEEEEEEVGVGHNLINRFHGARMDICRSLILEGLAVYQDANCSRVLAPYVPPPSSFSSSSDGKLLRVEKEKVDDS